MTETTITPKTSSKTTPKPKEDYYQRVVAGAAKEMKLPENTLLCPKCGSKHRTDLYGNPFCPEGDKSCSFK